MNYYPPWVRHAASSGQRDPMGQLRMSDTKRRCEAPTESAEKSCHLVRLVDLDGHVHALAPERIRDVQPSPRGRSVVVAANRVLLVAESPSEILRRIDLAKRPR